MRRPVQQPRPHTAFRAFGARSAMVCRATQCDVVVAGAGAVGLAIARQLAQGGQKVVLLERNEHVGQETSARNSEVLHAGMYYPPGTLKARACVDGRHMLEEYAKANGVPYSQLGKLIVAQNEQQRQYLEKLLKQAHANRVPECRMVSGEEAKELEPEVTAVAGLHCTVTGIIDSTALMAAFRKDAEEAGAEVRTSTELVDAQPGTSGLDITTKERGTGGGAQASLQARWLVNSAGLRAHDIATRVAHLPEDKIPRIRFAKGNYFLAPGEHVFSRLVYPVPEDGGLGAHLTIDLDQNIKFGPDVEWLETNNADEINYQVDPARRERFLQSVGQFWPAIHNRDMVEGYSGVRAKLSGPGEPDADFLIHGPQEHGAQGYVGLYGIESPGLTSCMELGRLVDEMIA